MILKDLKPGDQFTAYNYDQTVFLKTNSLTGDDAHCVVIKTGQNVLLGSLGEVMPHDAKPATSHPTEDGFYWACCGDFDDKGQVVQVVDDMVFTTYHTSAIPIARFVNWSKRLERP